MKVAVIGRGIAGLSCAFRLLAITKDIKIFGSTESPERASNAAQGIICNKGLFQARSPLFAGKLQSSKWVKDWVADLESQGADPIPKNFSGVYEPFLDHNDFQKQVKRIYYNRFLAGFGTKSQRQAPANFLTAPWFFHYPDDGWIDSAYLLRSLEGLLQRKGSQLSSSKILRITKADNKLVLHSQSGYESFDRVILANGAGMTDLLSNSSMWTPQLIAVAGQILRMTATSDYTNITVVKAKRSLVCYGGQISIGATSVASPSLSAQDLWEGRDQLSLAGTQEFGMAAQSAEHYQDIWGVRVRVKDRMPFWGAHPEDGLQNHLWLCGGLFKNGIQFADFLAQAVAADITQQMIEPLQQEFHLSRLIRNYPNS